MISKNSIKQILYLSITLVLAAWLTLGPATVVRVKAQTVATTSVELRVPLVADGNQSVQLVPVLAVPAQAVQFPLGLLNLGKLGVTDAQLINTGPSGSDDKDNWEDNDDATTPDNDSHMFIVDSTFPANLQCPNAKFKTIQSAVDAAPPGSKIKVCPGTYTEQVLIPSTKNNLKIFSRDHWTAIIQAPPTMVPRDSQDGSRAIVTVAGAQNVLIREFTITGPSSNIFAGVRVDNGGFAIIRHNHITQIQGSPNQNDGHGVNVGRCGAPDPITGACTETSGRAIVRHNQIDNYQKTGVFVDKDGSFGEVRHNLITGMGSSTPCNRAQNGIQVSRNAGAQVKNNKVSNNTFIPCTPVPTTPPSNFSGTGIVTAFENDPNFPTTGAFMVNHDDDLVELDHNYTFQNDVGIFLYIRTFEIEAEHNRSQTNSSGFAASYHPFDPSFQPMNNSIEDNKMISNTNFDCFDDTNGTNTGTTANFWDDDEGNTQFKPGICERE